MQDIFSDTCSIEGSADRDSQDPNVAHITIGCSRLKNGTCPLEAFLPINRRVRWSQYPTDADIRRETGKRVARVQPSCARS